MQCIPENPALWQIDRYEDFLEARRQLLAEQMNIWLEKITSTEEATAPATLEDLIAEGESDSLEFKSSLRWDFKQGLVNKKLEEVIVKTVAAFANAQGGTLLIGVDDEGQVVGIEQDYASLGDADRDKFELHLRNLFNQQFGTAFVSHAISVKFHTLNEQDVCQVDVQAATEPLIVSIKDKSGQTMERFYVRSGNSSQEVPMSQLSAYVKERFHQ